MKREPFQPPLMQLIDRLEGKSRNELMDLIVTLNAIGLDAKAHHAQALYDMGMRGIGAYPADENDPKQVAKSQQYISSLRFMFDHHNPDKRQEQHP